MCDLLPSRRLKGRQCLSTSIVNLFFWIVASYVCSQHLRALKVFAKRFFNHNSYPGPAGAYQRMSSCVRPQIRQIARYIRRTSDSSMFYQHVVLNHRPQKRTHSAAEQGSIIGQPHSLHRRLLLHSSIDLEVSGIQLSPCMSLQMGVSVNIAQHWYSVDDGHHNSLAVARLGHRKLQTKNFRPPQHRPSSTGGGDHGAVQPSSMSEHMQLPSYWQAGICIYTECLRPLQVVAFG